MNTAEYMTAVSITAAGSVDVSIPTDGAVLGVYSTSAVKLEWVFNGTVGLINAGTADWNPPIPFRPGPFSKLRITTTAAVDVCIRMV